MLVTLLGITVFLQPAIIVLEAVSIIELQLLRESYFVLSAETIIDVRPLQCANAPLPMLVTLFGIVMEDIPLHQEKALSSMFVTLFGIVMEVNPLHNVNAQLPMLVTLFGIVMEVNPLHS